ncbi:uncharacterized protein LOC108736973 [Agrilus planipennis]|uniref:Uncharacterized protein LOC108736973 n=1 Tax=Agrilus planipennis TaxID=224129 RepID=A0A1W4WX58_AGRPL|nr:uncharacterized protein LOC108736973 [Agrilus planipennis]
MVKPAVSGFKNQIPSTERINTVVVYPKEEKNIFKMTPTRVRSRSSTKSSHRGGRDRSTRKHNHPRYRESREPSIASRLSQTLVTGFERIIERYDGQSRRGEPQIDISRNIISDFKPLIHNLSDWLHSVDEFANMYGWSDMVTSYLALNKLKGPVEIWYRGLPTRMFRWLEWKDLLRGNFRQKRNLHNSLIAMMNFLLEGILDLTRPLEGHVHDIIVNWKDIEGWYRKYTI